MQARKIDSDHFAERCIEGEYFLKSYIQWTMCEDINECMYLRMVCSSAGRTVSALFPCQAFKLQTYSTETGVLS